MAPPSAASDMDRGRMIGKYQILTRLSVGGMAELFLAYTAGPGGFKKFVALKQILPDIKADESFVKMFLDEARITAAFNHANIGQVFDLGEEEEELYLAMEFIAGQNLEQVIKRAAKRDIPLPIGFSARVVRDTALGLHYAHNFVEPSGQPAPVVHRDISPKNVMVTYTGDVKVIDFGIAKARGRLGRTQVGVVKGTSGYMSPEQVRNEPLDGRSDLFCTATMLYELLLGERLFNVAGEVQMMLKIAEEEIPPLNSRNPEIPEALSNVVAKGLAKKREDRFATGKEFARAIEQASPELFDEDQVGAVMTQLFDDKIATTRALLEMAKAEDTRAMSKAVEELKKDVEEPAARKEAKHKATPGPRPGLTTPSRQPKSPSKQNLKAPPAKTPPQPPKKIRTKATDERAAADHDATIPPRRAPDPQKFQATRMFPEQAAKEEPEEEPAEDPPEEEPADRPDTRKSVPTVARNTQDIPAIRARNKGEAAPKKSGGGFMGFFLFILFVGGLGGLGWAGWMGPLKDSGPARAAREWLSKQTAEEVVAPPPADLRDVKPVGDEQNLPGWKKAENERLAAEKLEKEKQAAIEAQANDPEVQKNLKELDEQLKKLDSQQEELRTLKVAAAQGTKTGADNSKRIADLEKRNDELAKKIDALSGKVGKKNDPDKPKAGNDNVQVVNNNKTAKAAAVGYVTIHTVNPNSAAVFFGSQSLGTTPVDQIPIDSGVHMLRVVDGDSKNHDLSVRVEAGKTLELIGINVGSLPLSK